MSDPAFTGRCMCGAVTFESSSEAIFQANCHCDDCRRTGGGAFASFAFVPPEALSVKGETTSYHHVSDRGSEMTKTFCPNCGAPLFTANNSRPERWGVRVGAIDDASWFQPQVNVYASRKLPSTPMDEEVQAFDEMPG